MRVPTGSRAPRLQFRHLAERTAVTDQTNPVDGPELPSADAAAQSLGDRPAAFLNALLTEHFVLQSVRGVTVSESSTRASIYLMTLSSSLVAYGFLARSTYATGYLAVGPRAPNEMLDIGRRASWSGVFFTLSSAIGVVNSIVAGAGVAIILTALTTPPVSIGVGVGTTAVLAALHGIYQERRYAQLRRLVTSPSTP